MDLLLYTSPLVVIIILVPLFVTGEDTIVGDFVASNGLGFTVLLNLIVCLLASFISDVKQAGAIHQFSHS